MKNPIWKETYRGRAIYWHGGHSYGDETHITSTSIAEARKQIDAILAQAEDAKPAHLQYWDTLTPDVREKWRRLSISSELSAAELAYTNRIQ